MQSHTLCIPFPLCMGRGNERSKKINPDEDESITLYYLEQYAEKDEIFLKCGSFALHDE